MTRERPLLSLGRRAGAYSTEQEGEQNMISTVWATLHMPSVVLTMSTKEDDADGRGI
jgi:hypothetical protein